MATPSLINLYKLNMTISSWPYLASLLRTLHQHDPLNPYAAEVAMELMNSANTLALSLQTVDDTTIATLLSTGEIYHLPSSDSSNSEDTHLEFADLSSAKLFATHAMASIATNQILRAAMDFFGPVDATIFNMQNGEWSSRVLKCRTYAARQRDSFLVPALVVCFGVTEGSSERKRVVESVREMERWRYPCEKGLKGRWGEKSLAEMGMVLTGQGIFGTATTGNTQQGGGVEFWG